MGRIDLIANAVVIVLLLVVGFGVYVGEKASAAELRRTYDSILAQSQNETRQAITAGGESQRKNNSSVAQAQSETQQPIAACAESQRGNDSILVQAQNIARQSQARNSELTHEMAVALTRVQLILDVTEIGLQAEQGADTTQAMSTWYGRMAALNDPTFQNLHDPSIERTSNSEYVMFLASSV